MGGGGGAGATAYLTPDLSCRYTVEGERKKGEDNKWVRTIRTAVYACSCVFIHLGAPTTQANTKYILMKPEGGRATYHFIYHHSKRV